MQICTSFLLRVIQQGSLEEHSGRDSYFSCCGRSNREDWELGRHRTRVLWQPQDISISPPNFYLQDHLNSTEAAASMAEKVCSHHKNRRKRFFRRCCATLLIITFIILLTILIVWAVLQPKKPRFILQDATIFSLNVSAPNIISTTVQVTVFSRNPNSKIGIYYDRMYVYATYNSQQITYFTTIPAVYQGHKDVNVWSPFIYGINVPVAPYNGPGLTMALNNGVVTMMIKLNGRVKWKVGTFTTGRYHLHVSCQANIPIGNSKSSGIIIGTAVKYQLQQSCSVSV